MIILSGLIPVIFAVIALIVLLWLFLTPSGKVVVAKMQASEEITKGKIQKARNILTTTAKLAVIDEQAIQKIAQAFSDLNETKTYWKGRIILATQIYQEIRQVAPSIISKVSPASGIYESIFDFLINSAISSQELYDLSLIALEANPSNSKSKQLVLKIGRYHFGKMRGGKATIYDEQAIQNDIQVRSS